MKKVALRLFVGTAGNGSFPSAEFFERLDESTKVMLARKPTELESSRVGFAPLIEDGPLYAYDKGVLTCRVTHEFKVIPADAKRRKQLEAIDSELARLQAQAEEQQQPVPEALSADEENKIKDAVNAEMMKHANTKIVSTLVQFVSINDEQYFVAVQSSSGSATDNVTTFLRIALGKLPVAKIGNLTGMLNKDFKRWAQTGLEFGALLGENVKFNNSLTMIDQDTARVTVKETAKLNKSWLLNTLKDMDVIQIGLAGTSSAGDWDMTLDSDCVIKGLELSVNYDEVECELASQRLMMFQADMLFIGAWLRDFTVYLVKLCENDELLSGTRVQEQIDIATSKSLMDTKGTLKVMDSTLQPEETDPLLDDAKVWVVSEQRVSVSQIQRQFRIGYNRAARLVESLVSLQVVSEPDHVGIRTVLVSQDKLA